MTLDAERLVTELATFTDLGAGAPTVTEGDKEIAIRLVRDGARYDLSFDKTNGTVVESDEDGNNIRHVSYRALLASDKYANLRRWANDQYQFLQKIIDENHIISTKGTFSTGIDTTRHDADINYVDEFLSKPFEKETDSIRTLLIDGPAGIGKTNLVERLALLRARDFIKTQKPLILHVQSRGRLLPYLQDLIAFSLQTIRARVTYDQAPILVRHGLIQLAIDGFDELGDPDGYENAWGQIRQTIEDIEGNGTLILAGRETFIGRERLLKAVTRLERDNSILGVLSLRSVNQNEAKSWLKRKGWTDQRVNTADKLGLFDQNSYALRPFFLSKLSELTLGDEDDFGNQPLIALTSAMISREAAKFGHRVDEAMDQQKREQFIRDVLGETAREMAESQNESIDQQSLLWIVDTVLGDDFNPELARLLKNRILAIAFLQEDDRPGRRRFSHSEFQNYFLTHATISAITQSEVPKYIRRTTLGTDFLITFTTVLAALPATEIEDFVKSVRSLLDRNIGLDSSENNFAGLLLATLSATEENQTISGLSIGDAVITGKTCNATIENVTINQLDIRGADVSGITFDQTTIGALIVDETTRVAETFPDVAWLRLSRYGTSEETLSPNDAAKWLDDHGRNPGGQQADPLVPVDLRGHPIFELLEKTCRVMSRQHWIRENGDARTERAIFSSDYWNDLLELLHHHELVEQNDGMASGGRPSTFYHVRKATTILTALYGSASDEDVEALIGDIRALTEAPGY